MKYKIAIHVVFFMFLSILSSDYLNSQDLPYIFGSGSGNISDAVIAADSTIYVNELEYTGYQNYVSRVYKSTDLGQNWDMIWVRESYFEMEPVKTYFFNYISALNKDSVILFGAQGTVYSSINGGISWDSSYIKEGFLDAVVCFRKSKNQLAILFEESDKMVYSKNYGFDWEYIDIPKTHISKCANTILLGEEDNFVVSRSYMDFDYARYRAIIDKYSEGSWILTDTLESIGGIYDLKRLKNGDLIVVNMDEDERVKVGSDIYMKYSYKKYNTDFEEEEKFIEKNIIYGDFLFPTIEAYGDRVLVTINDTLWITDDYGATWDYLKKEKHIHKYKSNLKGADLLENGLGVYHDQGAVHLYNPNPTSVAEEMSSNESISIYPNPSSGVFTVSRDEPGVQDIRVYDVQGNEVGVLDGLSSEHDLSHLPSGTYYLRFDYKEKVKIRKIVLSN